MRVEFIRPFVEAAYRVLEQEVRAEVQKGKLAIKEVSFTTQEITVMIGVVGKVQGTVLYGMAERTAKNLVSAMTGERVPIFNSLVESAVAEMGNVITGLASTGLESSGYECRISPPTVVIGRGVIISTINIKRLVIPLLTQYGDIEISVALREDKTGD